MILLILFALAGLFYAGVAFFYSIVIHWALVAILAHAVPWFPVFVISVILSLLTVRPNITIRRK